MEDFQLQMSEYLPLRDVVFETLRQAILKGNLKPGERLMEIHLAQKLGVSRTPVREAIRKLELEGLVVMIPRRGAIVADITLSDLKDVLEVREALEELAARLACKSITADQLDALKKLAEKFKKCLNENDIAECAQADMEFHEAIYHATGNGRLVQILNNLREQIYRYRIESLKDRNTYPILLEEHKQILEALEKRDEKLALEATSRHIKRQKEHIIKGLGMR